jgi:tryptophan-rich sensory protein
VKNTKLYPIANTFTFLLCLYINFLSATGRLGGKNIRELSDKYENLFTPSNQTFAIWSLLYTLLLVVLMGEFIKKEKSHTLQTPLFIISCVLNFCWIIVWQQDLIGLSLLIMIGLLVSLARINYALKSQPISLLKIAFGVYIGWICIATIANVTTLLVSFRLSIPIETQRLLAQAVIITGMGIATGAASKLRNPSILLPVLWAFYGIYSKRSSDFPTIAITAVASGIFMVLLALINNRRIKSNLFCSKQ